MAAIAQEIETALAVREGKELVRVVVIGSVDDGKSTLIGRLLYETGAAYADQIAQVKRATKNGDPIDFSLFTDGLHAEREQGITIDVAYRYFETPRRKFILADTPGHAQYTRNMATGASTADAAIILVDARLGVLAQSRRHATIASLLGIPRLAIAINKMDLVAFDPAVYQRIVDEVRTFTGQLRFKKLSFFPVSAKHGDNVVTRSQRTPWHKGGTILDYLATVELDREQESAAFRFPVQTVIRASLDYRGLAGQIASGVVAVGDEIVVLPSGVRTRIHAIDSFDGPLEVAAASQSVVLRLADEVDAGRGDLLAHPEAAPKVRMEFEATVVWLAERALDTSRQYLLKHTTRQVPAWVEAVRSRLDPETLAEQPANALVLNDIGKIAVRCARPLVCDSYLVNRATGAFILIDAFTNETVAAGTILEVDRLEGERTGRAVAGLVVLVQRDRDSEFSAFADEVENFVSQRGQIGAVVRAPEGALACAAAGLVAICPVRGEERASQVRAALSASGAAVLYVTAGGGWTDAMEVALRELGSGS